MRTAIIAGKCEIYDKGKAPAEKRIDAIGGGGNTYNFDNPIILTQKDLGYILHTYHVVEYLKGMAVLAQGPDTTIIVNGYLAISITSSGTDWLNHKGYGKIEFYGNRSSADTSPEKVVIRSEIAKASPTSVTVALYDNDDKVASITTFGGEWHFILVFNEIFAPSEYFPNGSALCSVKFVFTNNRGQLESYDVGYLGRVEFAGVAEYNAAIRLYREPYYGSDVTETTIVDDGSSTLEKAMQYTDRVTAELKTSIDNITDADRQQITRNTEDIAAIDKRVATAEGTLSDITDPTSGIFAKSMEYTDAAIDSITTS